MHLNKKEFSEIIETSVIVAGLCMMCATGAYLYDYADKKQNKYQKKQPIHSIEAKKVTHQPVASVQFLNGQQHVR